jgi:hypothetical protein
MSYTGDVTGTKVIVWQCPTCTWFRARTSNEKWEQKIIPHPLYGRISNYDLFAKEVETHDCDETRKARERFSVEPDARYNQSGRRVDDGGPGYPA